jgi:hypothetical protein
LSPRALLGFALAEVTRLMRAIYDARLSSDGLSGVTSTSVVEIQGVSRCKLIRPRAV